MIDSMSKRAPSVTGMVIIMQIAPRRHVVDIAHQKNMSQKFVLSMKTKRLKNLNVLIVRTKENHTKVILVTGTNVQYF